MTANLGQCQCYDDACCRDRNGHGKGQCDHPSGKACKCARNAVRNVTVQIETSPGKIISLAIKQLVPMCEPCAQYHEKKGS